MRPNILNPIFMSLLVLVLVKRGASKPQGIHAPCAFWRAASERCRHQTRGNLRAQADSASCSLLGVPFQRSTSLCRIRGRSGTVRSPVGSDCRRRGPSRRSPRRPAPRTPNAAIAGNNLLFYFSANVLQSEIAPFASPRLNHSTRCAEEP